MSFRTLSAILRGRWLLDKQWAESQLPLVLNLLQGRSAAVPRSGNEMVEMPFAIDPQTMQRSEMFVHTGYGLIANPNIPEGSVAIIPVSGPIMKYNGECGEPGSIQRIGWLMDAERRNNISSAVLLIDSPGGQVDGTQSFANAIKSFSKPILGYVDDGMAASAAIEWILSAANEAYTSLESVQVGSIGVYTSILDYKGYLEMNGLKMHEIYAPQSTEKNKDYRDAIAGNYEAVLDAPATITGNQVTFSITDGGLCDDEWALGPNGTVVDQGGPGALLVTGVPSLSAWSMAVLSALLLLSVVVVHGRRFR